MSPAPIVEPIIVSDGPDCRFYRGPAAAIAAGIPLRAKIFDGRGRRLERRTDHLVVSANADGVDELANLLREWLGYMDALRESTMGWSLALLIRASVDHLGYTG